MAFDLKDYSEVHERVAAFNEKYPEGSIQTEIAHLSEKLVIVKAHAYRNAMDLRPSVAHSQLAIPGTTPYTKGSEVENAETSAVGRALAFMGFAAKKSIASRDEIMNKQAPAPAKAAPKTVAAQKAWMKEANVFAKEAGSSIRETLNLPDAANPVVELDKWQAGNGYTDEEALAEFKGLVAVKVVVG